VTIHLKSGPISCISTYSKSKATISNKTLDNWLPDNKPIIYAGDFNAKHKIWGCNTTNTKGNMVDFEFTFQKNSPTGMVPTDQIFLTSLFTKIFRRNLQPKSYY